MSSAALPCHYAAGDRRERWLAWLPAVLLVTLLHGGVWFAYGAWHSQAVPQPLQVVQVSLLTLPAPQQQPAAPQIQRAPARPKPPAAIARQAETPAPPAPDNAVTEPSTSPAEATESTPATAQEEYSQPLYNATYLNNPPPLYPLAARRRGIEGTVVVRAQIEEDGHCLQAQLGRSSGHAMLDKAAVAAVSSWRFIPAKRGTQAITAWVDVPITFRLEDAQS